MEHWVIASSNKGKLRELTALLAPYRVELTPQSEFDVSDAEETGLTFVENAILKARHAAAVTGLPALADDSGLAVDVLNGAPGIYSARYAGAGANDADNVAKLLGAMQGKTQRAAAFHCVIAFLRHAHDPSPIIAQGIWHGTITASPQGNNGFGYDPVFWVPEQGCTSAELDAETKNRISHRGRALQQFLSLLAAAQNDQLAR